MLKKIKNALISVSDKEDLLDILETLSKFEVNIISSGGTYKKINSLGFNCENLSITACVPKSAEQEDQTAPILAADKKLIIVSGIFGRYPTTTSPFLIPRP